MKPFSIIVAVDEDNGIGKNNQVPWHNSSDKDYNLISKLDLTYFKKTTANSVIIMGRKTWDSLPRKPLPNRVNIVITSNPLIHSSFENTFFLTSFENVINLLSESIISKRIVNDKKIFVIGGEEIYKIAVNHPLCHTVLITRLFENFDCDKFFPELDTTWDLKKLVKLDETYTQITDKVIFETYNKRNIEEQIYLNLVKDILNHGTLKNDRTGIGTLSKFGLHMRFDLKNNVIPLLTTKKVFWRGVVEELLWFISGSTDSKILEEKNINIWKGHTSREFLDCLGFKNRDEGDLGPCYGWQWRHMGAKYIDKYTDYTNQGVDQLQKCIDQIKNSPNSRRIILTAWNPMDLNQMVLPPCHMFCQFYVANGELSCQMYQRSADMGLGVPFNIASYSLLTHMIAKVCSLKPGEFIHTIGDAHIYLNHLEALEEQILRSPRPFPVIKINNDVKNIDDFKYQDFTLQGYDPLPSIKMEMAI